MASSLVNLRPYQKQAIADMRAALERSGSVVLQMPTGSGKTYTAAEFIRQESMKGAVWFIAHRREIIKQTAEKFSEVGLTYDVIAPDYVPGESETGYFRGAAIKIASVDTLRVRRLTITDRPSMAFIDEAHHTPAGTWSEVYEWLGDIPIVGLTATPERLDKKPLSPWFKELVRGPDTADLVDNADLARPRIFAPSQPDLSAAKISKAGDYTDKSLDQIMNTPVLIGNVVEEYKRHASGARAIVFTTSVKAAENVSAQFNAAGIPAAQVNAKTPVGERDAAIRDLAAGRIKVLANYGVFTEGVDVKETDAVILMRPTKSLALYLQMVGRGMRKKPGANEVIILDHAGMVYERGNPLERHDWSLEGGAWRRFIQKERAEGGAGVRKCPSCSEVYFDRPEVCSCGHVFASGREVGEFDGVLHEFSDGIPLGFESANSFADRVGVTPKVVRLNMSRGLPTDASGRWISVEAGLKWWGDQYKPKAWSFKERPGFEYSRSFAKRIGVSASSVHKWVKLGLPTSTDGLIEVVPAIKWVKENTKFGHHLENPENASPISAAEFAARHGYTITTTFRWMRSGMPKCPDGRIDEVRALEWIAAKRKVGSVRAHSGALDLGVSAAHLARIVGTKSGIVSAWKLQGLPVNECGLFDLEQSIVWLKRKASPKIPPIWEASPRDFESTSDFCSRLGRGNSSINYWKKRGLPCASNGWVHIRKGLEWVRDNTNIAIPPEAWPKDGDDE